MDGKVGLDDQYSESLINIRDFLVADGYFFTIRPMKFLYEVGQAEPRLRGAPSRFRLVAEYLPASK